MEELIKAMTYAQFGSEQNSNFIESHMKEYFVRWPAYKDKLHHLEWYHLFLDVIERYEMMKAGETFTKRELEMAFCMGLLNQKDLTMDKLSEELKHQKFPRILDAIIKMRTETI